MRKMLEYLPGVIGAFSGFVLLKFFTWTGLRYELVFFLLIYVLVTILVERAMRRYGR